MPRLFGLRVLIPTNTPLLAASRGLTLAATVVLAGATALAAPSALAAQAPADHDPDGCSLCHGEVELLRQHVPTLADAERFTVTEEVIAASAHVDESCSSCHSGYTRWPHPDDGQTESCVSCHEEQAELFDLGIHAHPLSTSMEPAACVDCHGTHAVRTLEQLRDTAGIHAMNANCVSCHETQSLALHDPHADSVSCAGCHSPHDTRGVGQATSAIAPMSQAATCGVCHEEAAEAFPLDAHGAALSTSGLRTIPALDSVGYDAAPTCTTCHGGHDMLAVEAPDAIVLHVDGCANCHMVEAERYFGTYHGKATALGSHVVASCDDCHGAHGIYASTSPESWLHEERVIETCATCHEQARPAFVSYDSHPDPMDPDRNGPLFMAFIGMNTLLFGVLIVFGLHTFLWWVRILIDQRRPKADGGHHG